MIIDNAEQSFQTSDLSLETTLSMFVPMADIDRTNPRKALFIFTSTPAIESLISSYWQGTIQVNPQGYYNALHNIKAKLYAEAT